MGHAIIPTEILTRANELFGPCNVTTFGDLFANQFKPLDYDTVMRELDAWHDVNIWSNAPSMIEADGLSTKGCIDTMRQILSTTDGLDTVSRAMAEATVIDIDTVREWLTSGVPEQFAETMTNMRKYAESLL